jgi:tetratricopeptide (TPR) repeat protein
MNGKRAMLVPVAVLAAIAASGARAQAGETGQVLPDVSLTRVDGGTAPLVDGAAAATALVFFRAGQERSEETLRMLAGCESRLAGKPARIVGVVPADSAEGAKAALAASKAKLTVLVDPGDVVYAAAGVRTHPVVVVVDRARRVLAFEPYHQVGYCDAVVARVRRALGEIGDAEVAQALAPAPSALPEEPGGVARRHVSLGRKLLDAKVYAPAHDNARKAIAVAPTADAWRLEGDIFAAEGRCGEADRAFDAALALDPNDAAAAKARQACGGR